MVERRQQLLQLLHPARNLGRVEHHALAAYLLLLLLLLVTVFALLAGLERARDDGVYVGRQRLGLVC